ncbi:hypothetical protein N431DRAFT_153773 [Stipitochalara longipes BDJ]|nr:hypothetical protein N431DRAFT_153773 [Stipitochalara longipes BDJ]
MTQTTYRIEDSDGLTNGASFKQADPLSRSFSVCRPASLFDRRRLLFLRYTLPTSSRESTVTPTSKEQCRSHPGSRLEPQGALNQTILMTENARVASKLQQPKKMEKKPRKLVFDGGRGQDLQTYKNALLRRSSRSRIVYLSLVPFFNLFFGCSCAKQ